ncbi:uncharacterized protein [Hyperolius riggenbachi]|uniref:uncharacterized protein n=1 Tax=Hyperolius riggenbachi TaxID=752182 RepID=UPI0035A38A8D
MNAAGCPVLLVLLLSSLCAVTATAPSTDLIDICPAFDSSICVRVKPGHPGCYNDSMCTYPKKCCCSSCTLQCVTPEKVKPGRCPNVKAKCNLKLVSNNCRSDSECPGGQKCCNICGQTCWNPKPDPVGICPMNDVQPSEVACGSVQCSRDVDCKPDEKCCPSGYSRTCVKPITDLIDVCPEFNSSICMYAKPGPPQCHDDSMCTAPNKCCCVNCGLQCVAPQKVKPGRCPNIKAKCNPELVKQCTRDIQCPGGQKCCNICGQTCWDPEPDPVGICPMDDVQPSEVACGSVQCSRDVDCKPDEKCCPSGYSRTCVKPITDLIDVCPKFNSSICMYAKPGPPQCHNDSMCTAPNKCCCINCGLQCVAPQIVKPGRCPNIKAKCNPELVRNCTRDIQCPGGQKCCNICGQTCWEPEPEPQGFCPPGKTSALQCPSVKCSRDSDCKPDKKCCLSGEGQKCVPPIAEKPGHCPDGKICKRNTYTCNDDTCCPKDQKCCSVCGRNCEDPVSEE